MQLAKPLLLSAVLLCLNAAPVIAAEDPAGLGMPAAIPHGVSAYLPIRIDRNACLTCHREAGTEVRKKGEIPASHYAAPGRISGERYECMLCHSETNAQTLHAAEDLNAPLE